ncbi:lycopene beta-cyclase CrtY [Candidatus Pantoea persica]|uniref:lycopene beta-cyclase CrtY n=1 Tax=Candidatus Pantoea persica TaxID=2518128 RepID=UPI00215D675B|nr:lycopene beta-cyclase CrtY [Candidatus Pantoea persica]MBA2813957.1 lycopene cyclase [Candidatus Pantoea persica]
MTSQYDLLLLGAGLANGLLALRLKQCQPALRLLVLDAEAHTGGNHTWCFHAEDLTAQQHYWIAPLVAHRWPHYEVRFPRLTRQLDSGYLCVTSTRFDEVLRAELQDVMRLNQTIASCGEDHVRLASGEILRARAVIDGRGYQPDAALQIGFQAFIGQEWTLSQPHALSGPILMDATVDQQEGYRFVYTLPLSPTRLLIEDTHYIDNMSLSAAQARQNICDYATRQGWMLETLAREERGALPITLAGDFNRFWQHRQGCVGLRAGLFHPTTGYSLSLAASLADALAARRDFSPETLAPCIHRFAQDAWRRQGFFRLLNRMLFLAGDADQRWRVMQRFYGLPQGLIARFYAGRLTLADRARILSGKPPVPLLAALQAAFTQPSGRRASR